MKRPFVAVVSLYALGLFLAGLFKPPLTTLFIASSLVLLMVLAVKKWRAVFLCGLLVLTGWTNLVFHTAIISPNDLRLLIGDKTQPVTVRGTLLQTPQIRFSQRRGDEIAHSLTQVRVTEIQIGDHFSPAEGNIIVSSPGLPGTNYFAGQSVELSGTIARPATAEAEGLFDYRGYLQARGIFYELKMRSADDWHLRDPILSHPPLTDRFLKWSRRTLALGLPEDQTLRLLWAMTLGWRTAFTGDVSDPFLRAGTMHMFAIDGLRIALISGMLLALLRVLQVSRGWCGVVAIPAIWFYTAATGWESPAVRASLMMSIVIAGWALKRPSDLLNSLGGAAFLILLWDPRQLFEASFQLSFSVMLTIALLLPPLNAFFERLLAPDPLLPPSLLPNWRRSLIGTFRLVAAYFSLSLASWLGSIPLSAHYFHLFSPVSPLANLIAVPLGTFALMANLGALICGAWLPIATGLFNNAAWFFMLGMDKVSDWSTRIPSSYIYVRAPSWIWIGVYFGTLFLLFSGWLNSARKKIVGVTAMVFVVCIYFICQNPWGRQTTLTVLPLEGGHTVFVNGDAGESLIDCGSADAVDFTLKPFLQAQGINRIPRLILTEGDSKNCGGVDVLDSYFGVRELCTSVTHFRSPMYNRIITSFEQTPSRHQILHFGDSVGPWHVLWPPDHGHFSRADDNAMVLLGNFYGTKALLLSDLSIAGQKELLSGTNDLRADIVVAGLPNQGEPIGVNLLNVVKPRLIVIADSEFPPRRRANGKLKARLEQFGIPVIYTSDAGSAKIVLDRTGWKWSTALEVATN